VDLLPARECGCGGDRNTTWTSILAFDDAPWLRDLWAEVVGDPFHYGCNRILSAYAANPWEGNPREQPLTIGAFLTTLDRAHGWLIPLDNDAGFLVGLHQGSALDRALRSGTI